MANSCYLFQDIPPLSQLQRKVLFLEQKITENTVKKKKTYSPVFLSVTNSAISQL